MMVIRGVTFLVVCWLAFTSFGYTEGQDEEPYKTKVDYKDKEDDVQILDKDDKLVAEVVVFPDEGYEVEKPVDSDVCLVRFLEDEDNCFDESPVEDGVPEAVEQFCAGKEVRLLNPAPCYDEEENTEEPGREKRFLGRICRRLRRTCNRVCGTRCCIGVFGRCIKRCKKYCPYDCFRRVCDIFG